MNSDYAYESEKGDVHSRTELLRQRNQIVRDIHTEFRALNIEIPTVGEKNSESFSKILEEIIDDSSEERKSDEVRD